MARYTARERREREETVSTAGRAGLVRPGRGRAAR